LKASKIDRLIEDKLNISKLLLKYITEWILIDCRKTATPLIYDLRFFLGCHIIIVRIYAK